MTRSGAPIQGFTLVEVLVALAVFAMIMGLVVTGLRVANRSWMTAEAETDHWADLRQTHRLFTRAVAGAHVGMADTRGAGRFEFEGTGQSMSVLTYRPAQAARGGLYQLVFSIETGSGQSSLKVIAHPHGTGGEGGHERTLLTTSGEIGLAYLSDGGRRGEDPRVWLSDWPRGATLPDLVRLRITGFPDRGTEPVEIIAATQRDLAANCFQAGASGDVIGVRSQCL